MKIKKNYFQAILQEVEEMFAMTTCDVTTVVNVSLIFMR